VDFTYIFLLLNKGLIRILYFIEFDIIMSCCFASSGNDGVKIVRKKKRERAKRLYDKLKSELEIRMLHEN
jgi:hypothetical protein